MVTVPIVPGKTAIQLLARGRANKIPALLSEVPGGLYPLKSAAYEVDEYRIMAGWPVPVPELDIRIDCLVSGEGNVLGVRQEPTALVTNADMRWVADADFYDQTAYLWRPLQSHVSPWQTSVAHAPAFISNYEYRIGSERFTGMAALNFDSNTDDYMWIDLTLAWGGTSGYTVILVLNPNSIYGNDENVDDNALWGPETIDGSWASFTVKDKAIWMRTEAMPQQKGVALGDALVSTAPTYVALVVGRPQTTMYAAPGPSKVLVKSLVAGPIPKPLSTRFRLGSNPFVGTDAPEIGVNLTSATMDMALLDVGLYGNLLTRAQVVAEFALLSQIYGGDD